MRLVTDVELRLAETHTQHRSGVVLAAVVGDCSDADEQVVARLEIPADGGVPDAAVVQPVAIRKDGVGTMCRRSLYALPISLPRAGRIDQPLCERVAGEIASDTLAQHLIDPASLG